MESVQTACNAVELVGSELRGVLKREIPAKILLRKARDVVLLTGPTGSGKEKVAAAIHEAARLELGRSGKLVEVNCANLGRGLFESELFGYKRGAFTGADRDHAGLISNAKNGTLVLDEIQSLSPEDQARLLRFLGEREFRSVGANEVHTTDALIVLSTNKNLRDLVQSGEFRRDVLDRAMAKINIPSLYERRKDIGELAQSFALEVGTELGADDFHGLTRRARADVETAVIRAQEVSVRRLREIVRDAVYMAAADSLPDALESDMIAPILETELQFCESDRDTQDREEIAQEFDLLVGRARLREIAEQHRVSLRTINKFSRAIQTVIEEMHDQPRSYRNVVERTNRLAKVALWLVSGANTQAEFRRYFGNQDAEMPTKSVAHQIFHEVFAKNGREQ